MYIFIGKEINQGNRCPKASCDQIKFLEDKRRHQQRMMMKPVF